jgi:hypothetical protein
MSFPGKVWHWLTWRHWAWAIGASTAVFASVPVFNANISSGMGWSRIYYFLPWYVGIGCVYLVALATVEVRAAPRVPGPKAYFGAAIVAAALSLAALGSFHAYVYRPPIRIEDGRAAPPIAPHLKAAASRSSAMLGFGFDPILYGVIGTLIYAYLRRARHAEEILARTELARAASRQRLTAARLEAGQAAVDPAAVMAELERIEAVYAQDAARGDASMDELISQLRDSIPRLHERSDAEPHEAHSAAG